LPAQPLVARVGCQYGFSTADLQTGKAFSIFAACSFRSARSQWP
jgi:hypothetical protein